MMARLTTTDHEVLGRRFLWLGLTFLLIGGALAMILRWQRAFPGQPVPLIGQLLMPGSDGIVSPPAYAALFSSHGLIMVFFAITPVLLGGVGYLVVPAALGARRLAWPAMSAAALWLTGAGQLCALASLVIGNAPSAGWTNYPPLSTGSGAPGPGQGLMMVAILLAGLAAVASSSSLIATVAAGRVRGMSLMRMPLTVWGVWLAACLTALFAPVLIAGTGLLMIERFVGVQLFAGSAGDPLLYQHLFWLFGHPEVYILVLPIWGIVGDLLATFARKPAFFYRGTVMAMIAVAAMSGLVYGHHMFRAGISPMVGTGFEALTLLISVPSTVLFLNWMGTLWRGSIRLEVPMLFALGTMIVFALGGLSGITLGAITTDLWLHDSMYVVGHFHLIMATATLMGSFAAIYYWFPRWFGRELNRRLGQIHFAGTLVFSIVTFGSLLAAGYAGQPRRYLDLDDFEFLAKLVPFDRHTSFAAFLLGAFQLVFAFNLWRTLRRGGDVSGNPWQATTLEWAPGPIEAAFREPHHFADPAVRRSRDRDYLGQWEAGDD